MACKISNCFAITEIFHPFLAVLRPNWGLCGAIGAKMVCIFLLIPIIYLSLHYNSQGNRPAARPAGAHKSVRHDGWHAKEPTASHFHTLNINFWALFEIAITLLSCVIFRLASVIHSHNHSIHPPQGGNFLTRESSEKATNQSKQFTLHASSRHSHCTTCGPQPRTCRAQSSWE